MSERGLEGPRAPSGQSSGAREVLSLGSRTHGGSAARGCFLEGEAPLLDLERRRVGPGFLARDEILRDLPGWEWGMGRGAATLPTAVREHERPPGGSDAV